MKKIKYIPILVVFFAFYNCSKNNATKMETDDLSGLVKIQELVNDTHIITIYSESGVLKQGYNEISLKIQDKSTKNDITVDHIDWTPVMNMTSMKHSCPVSAIVKVADKKTLYRGMILFQMAQNDLEYWNLTIDYQVHHTEYHVVDRIAVYPSDKRTVNVFSGPDGARYVLGYIEPKKPSIGLNDMVVGLYKMENMMTFSTVDHYKIKIDPRMPSMGNHGSPNNVDLTQPIAGGFYYGKLALTMTGEWDINLQVLNSVGEVVKGEAVTQEHPKSSIFFEVVF